MFADYTTAAPVSAPAPKRVVSGRIFGFADEGDGSVGVARWPMSGARFCVPRFPHTA